jgi:LacI family transcriptional regulator, sucrose operon repressor
LLHEICQLNIPFIMVGQHAEELTSVIFDEYQAARDMTGLLIQKGYKKIAFIGVDEADRAVGYLRKQGYLDAMKEHHLPLEAGWLQKGIFDIDSGFNSMKNIMECAEDKPQAVLTVTDRLAIGAIQYLRQNGYSIPDDVAIAGMGGSELSKYITPALTTIDFSFEDAGREAALLILQKIKGEHSPEEARKINYRLVDRESI